MFKKITYFILAFFLPLALTFAQGLDVEWEEEYPLTYIHRQNRVPKVCVWDDAVYVGWMRNGSVHEFDRIFLRSSFDRGSTWSEDVMVSPWEPTEPIFNTTAYFDVWCGSVYAVFKEHQTSYPHFSGASFTASVDSGQTWFDTTMTLIDDSHHPGISVWRDTINIVCFGEGMEKHTISYDGGQTFQPQDTLANLAGEAQTPGIEAYKNYVLFTYTAFWDSTMSGEVFFQRSTNGGVTFETFVMLSTPDIYHSQLSSLAFTEEGHIYVCWKDYKYSPYPTYGDILVRHSPDWGETWEDEVQVTFNHYASKNSISALGSAVHIVFQDARWGSSNSELYYRNSSDYGQNWSEETRLTEAEGTSMSPWLAQKADTLHLVWSDGRNIHNQIYYKRGVIIESGVEFPSPDIPAGYELVLDACPNPFNSSLAIHFELPVGNHIKLNIYNILGKEVIKLHEGSLSPGSYSFTWDGNDYGRFPASSGVYFVVLCAGDFTAVAKMLLIK